MILAFERIVDARGLCSLRQDSGTGSHGAVSCPQNRIPFWAVLDTQDASRILKEMLSGNRQRALQLLEELAISLGGKSD